MIRLATAIAALSLGACEVPKAVQGTEGPSVTLAQFSQLKDGMSYREAVAVLGSEGVEQSSTNIGDMKTVMYGWNGNTVGGNLSVMFQNDKLVQKSQFGLE